MTITTRRILKNLIIISMQGSINTIAYSKRKLSRSLRKTLSCQLHTSAGHTASDYAKVPIQFSSVAQLCPTLCNPMNCRMPGLPVHHQLPEFTETHVHRVGDAIQPSHPGSPPFPPAPNPSQNHVLLQ